MIIRFDPNKNTDVFRSISYAVERFTLRGRTTRNPQYHRGNYLLPTLKRLFARVPTVLDRFTSSPHRQALHCKPVLNISGGLMNTIPYAINNHDIKLLSDDEFPIVLWWPFDMPLSLFKLNYISYLFTNKFIRIKTAVTYII